MHMYPTLYYMCELKKNICKQVLTVREYCHAEQKKF